MQARIVFEGRVKYGDEIIFANNSPTSTTCPSARATSSRTYDKFQHHPAGPVHERTQGSAHGPAEKGNGGDGRFSGLVAKESDVVDLESFTRARHSFDYAAQFFKYHAPVLKDWEDRFSRDNASWKGEAAEVFRSLIKKIRENYDNYMRGRQRDCGQR
ncbi:POLO box domain-containing protein OS=Streptomyces microflavus OX=1919 GN=Smic_63960 PE=4 SV=1 [Streptomyces microflavus]